MHPQSTPHSSSWTVFTYASFVGSVSMIGIGIVYAPIDVWIKAYFAMGVIMIIQSSITLTKTLRDIQESEKFVNRIEDAKAERILMGIEASR
jgi:hypothetical protein